MGDRDAGSHREMVGVGRACGALMSSSDVTSAVSRQGAAMCLSGEGTKEKSKTICLSAREPCSCGLLTRIKAHCVIVWNLSPPVMSLSLNTMMDILYVHLKGTMSNFDSLSEKSHIIVNESSLLPR